MADDTKIGMSPGPSPGRIGEIYSSAFYSQRTAKDVAEYRAIADLLYEALSPAKVLDLGCGPGELIARLQERGVEVYGVDGSPHAREAASQEIQPRIVTGDLTDSVCVLVNPDSTPYVPDLVVCTETAEHIPAEQAPALFRTITRHMHWNPSARLFFSAAYPGQGGTDHVNEREEGYWVRLAQSFKLVPNWALTGHLRTHLLQAAPTQAYYGRTAILFERAGEV
jgi:SAM-dependent methyltransferase